MGKKTKQNLEQKMTGSMTLKTAIRTTTIQQCIFRWFIFQYDLLEKERLYCQAFVANGFHYSYKLLKTKERLYIAFQCDYSNAHGRFFLTRDHEIVNEIEAIEISDGLYIGEFEESLLLSDESGYQEKGCLRVAFRFMKDCQTSEEYSRIGEIRYQLDFDDLSHSVQDMYLDAINSDFIFHCDNFSLKAHKCVLYARSKFFKKFFTEDEENSEISMPDIAPEIMHEVLLYMYSGELCNTQTESVVKVLEAAYLLDIPSLKERCFDYFEETNSWEAVEGVKFYEYKIED